MEISGNTDALVKLFEIAATAVRVGRPETIAEAIEAYQIFQDTRCQAKFTDEKILDGLSDLKDEWTAFLSRDPNADKDDVAAVTTAVAEIHRAIENALRGKMNCEIEKSALDTLCRAATGVASMRRRHDSTMEDERFVDTGIKKQLDDIRSGQGAIISRLKTIQKTVDGDHTKVTEKSRANETRVKKAVGLTYKLIKKGTKRRNAVTDACREVEQGMGLGDYANFESFRNAVARIIAENERHYGDKAVKVYFEEHRDVELK